MPFLDAEDVGEVARRDQQRSAALGEHKASGSQDPEFGALRQKKSFAAILDG
jgi:hypothetical protein